MNDQRHIENEQILDRAIAQIRQLPVPQSPDAHVFLDRIPSQSRTSARPMPQSAGTHKRFLMRPAFQLTATAIFLLTASWLLLSSPASIALAEVIAAATNYRVVSYTFNASADFEDSGEATASEIVYVDLKSPRFRIERRERTLNNAVQSDWVTVQDNQKDRTLVTSSLELAVTEEQATDQNQLQAIRVFTNSGDAGKKARLFRTGDEGLRPFTNLKTDKTFLEILQNLQDHKDVVSAHEKLNGQETCKYRLEQDNSTVILWVDVATKLPVRIEQELRDPRPEIKRWKWVYADFGWDVDVKKLDELFSITPPEGYTLDDHTSK
jgi:hypothetical protein